jgi:hypothetical protein
MSDKSDLGVIAGSQVISRLPRRIGEMSESIVDGLTVYFGQSYVDRCMMQLSHVDRPK